MPAPRQHEGGEAEPQEVQDQHLRSAQPRLQNDLKACVFRCFMAQNILFRAFASFFLKAKGLFSRAARLHVHPETFFSPPAQVVSVRPRSNASDFKMDISKSIINYLKNSRSFFYNRC